MKGPPRWLWISWAIPAAAAVVVAARGARVELVEHERYAADLGEIVALDARLDGEVMRARQALVAHYDALVRTTTAIRALHRRARALPGFVGEGEREDLAARVAASEVAADDKLDLIESFKSHNAVLRNSVRFFPAAAEALRDRLAAAGADGASAATNRLLTRTLSLVERPGSAVELARAREALDELVGEPAPAALEADRELVASHAEVILERGWAAAALSERVLASPATRRALDAEASYGRAFERAIQAGARTQLTTLGLVLVTLAALAAEIILRLRASAAEVRRANERLAEANDALARENARERELRDLKSRFVSMASHEFRTPLAVILSSMELVEAYGDRWSPAKKADHFTRVRRAVSDMTALLDRILVIGRADSGRLVSSPARLDVAAWARAALEAFETTLSGAHRLDVEVSETGERWADEKLLGHVLTNLLSNAVKYSPEGGTVTVRLEPDEEGIALSVRDEGIGIPVADQARLFENFQRAGNVGAIRGTGLGLAIVKRSVEAHGGSIEVESEPGRGTCFRVHLRCDPPGDAEAAPPS